MGAYVPLCQADVFVSYAHADDGAPSWSEALIAELEREVRKRLGREVGHEFQIWRDKDHIRLGANWPQELETTIRTTAIFLALVSPNYMTSRVCSTERETFLKVFDDADTAAALRLMTQSRRFLKIIRLPLDNNDHRRFLPDVHSEDLFEVSEGIASEMQPASEAFRRRVVKCAAAIKDVVQALRRQREKVFIATPATDCQTYRDGVHSELTRQGYDVQPTIRIDGFVTDDLVRDYMAGSRLSIHLLGAKYDGTAERQIRIAAELGLRQAFWLSWDAASTTDERQLELLARIKDGRASKTLELPHGWSLRESVPMQRLCDDVLSMLKQRATTPPRQRSSETPSVYLCCDRTTPGDSEFALRLLTDIQEAAGVEVQIPPEEPSEAHHESCLRLCDGVLVYGEAAPRRWMNQVLQDVTYAENLYQRQPLRAKGLLTPDISPWSSYPVRPFQKKPQFSVSELHPFLDALRQTSSDARA